MRQAMLQETSLRATMTFPPQLGDCVSKPAFFRFFDAHRASR
jgi:hypothetical protein